MRQIGALLVESMPQGTGNWTKSRQVADVQCPVTFVETCNINALDKDAEDAGPATQTVTTYWEPWRWGRYITVLARATPGDVSQYSATAHRALFRLLMCRKLVLVGDGCWVSGRKSR